jgi:hypothetical protein
MRNFRASQLCVYAFHQRRVLEDLQAGAARGYPGRVETNVLRRLSENSNVLAVAGHRDVRRDVVQVPSEFRLGSVTLFVSAR